MSQWKPGGFRPHSCDAGPCSKWWAVLLGWGEDQQDPGLGKGFLGDVLTEPVLQDRGLAPRTKSLSPCQVGCP